jgi:predicted nucleic-acid-binding protein
MRITVDTNILIRAVVRDDAKQATAAARLLKDAEIIAVPLPCPYEFVWVLLRVYGLGRKNIHAALQALLNAGNVAVNRTAVALLGKQGQATKVFS